jgi:polysaccharide pyruvyl transferase WcaK-like protein
MRSDLVVGLSPMAFCDPRSWPVKDGGLYRRYLGNLAILACSIIEAGGRIVLFASQTRMDRPVLADLRRLIALQDDRPETMAAISEPPAASLAELLTLLAGLDLVVASRMHGLLLSMLVHTPTLAISYDPKVTGLMGSFGLSEFCFDIHRAEAPALQSGLARLMTRREEIRAVLRRGVAERRNALQQQYDLVLGTGTPPTPDPDAPLLAGPRRTFGARRSA